MAKKYTSINFNHIYEKTNSTSSSSTNAPKNPSFSSSSYSAVSALNKPHGRILVLTRPTPKPVTPPAPSQPQQHHNPIQQVLHQPRSEPGSEAISLRPLGRTGTGTGSSLASPVLNCDKDKDLPSPQPLISPKPDKFVPPHLRPGFVPREEVPGPEPVRSGDAGHRRQSHVGSPGRYGEDGRPKSGGYERVRSGGGSDMGILGRPRSSGSRPSSSG